MNPGVFLADMVIPSASPEETTAIGERIGRLLRAGAVVALRGSLGAGKTCFTKGIGRALGVREEVTSPTYTIVSEYPSPIPLYHIDAYRLSGDDDFESLGGSEILYGGGVSVIEWSERIPGSIPNTALVIELELSGGDNRNIRILNAGPLTDGDVRQILENNR
ncbi:tRNA (adenosine(37)-N6)-threonylcarbamoyltransferase complex ATPase subunit type 1 TsaE [Spirochaetia bacterium]|nr:tRNA (adenosine(37)-N6)-threonylcarbamoyltransferase complex ATPase subunit type 1 TsaE [Spirochaetia bacterium]